LLILLPEPISETTLWFLLRAVQAESLTKCIMLILLPKQASLLLRHWWRIGGGSREWHLGG
jgi:hypothetical protein